MADLDTELKAARALWERDHKPPSDIWLLIEAAAFGAVVAWAALSGNVYAWIFLGIGVARLVNILADLLRAQLYEAGQLKAYLAVLLEKSRC